MKKLFLILAGVACIGAAALMKDGKNESCNVDDTVIPAGDGVGGDNPDADDQPAD